MSTTVIGYARVSTDEQASEGHSLAVQERQIRTYCELHGLQLLRVERDEGVSAKNLNRPGWRRVAAALGKDAKGVVVVKLDRLSRSLRDVLDVFDHSARRGWDLHSVSERLDTSSAMGRFIVQLIAGLAELERGQTSERVTSVMSDLRRRGRKISRHPPFGFRFEDDQVVEEDVEQPLLRRIMELREEGLGARRIARALNEEDLVNPRTGRAWNYGTVAAVLRTIERRAGGR